MSTCGRTDLQCSHGSVTEIGPVKKSRTDRWCTFLQAESLVSPTLEHLAVCFGYLNMCGPSPALRVPNTSHVIGLLSWPRPNREPVRNEGVLPELGADGPLPSWPLSHCRSLATGDALNLMQNSHQALPGFGTAGDIGLHAQFSKRS